MALEQVMRSRWATRSDRELLRALFLEELSAEGRRVLGELARERVGDLDAYQRGFAAAQGDVLTRTRVSGCVLASDDALPVVWGKLVVCTGGIGFIPGGLDEAHLLAAGLTGRILSGTVGSLMRDLARTAHAVSDLRKARLPAPMIAALDPHAGWWPPSALDVISWDRGGGELGCRHVVLLRCEAATDISQAMIGWAAGHGIARSAPPARAR